MSTPSCLPACLPADRILPSARLPPSASQGLCRQASLLLPKRLLLPACTAEPPLPPTSSQPTSTTAPTASQPHHQLQSPPASAPASCVRTCAPAGLVQADKEHLGVFATEVDAARAVDRALIARRGIDSFAACNYALVEYMDLLTPQQVSPLLHGRCINPFGNAMWTPGGFAPAATAGPIA